MKTLDDFSKSPTEIYVLDTETTGLDGAPIDVVVDVGICKVNLEKGTVDDAYSEIVGHDIKKWNECRKNAWIFQNTDLTVDQVSYGRPFDTIRDEVEKLLRGKCLTTYNTEYDLNKFLYRDPWNLKNVFTECKDIMKAATTVCKLPSVYYGQFKYPKLDYAYSKILDGKDPANIHGKQDHRALSDARMASHLMIEMYNDNDYLPL